MKKKKKKSENIDKEFEKLQEVIQSIKQKNGELKEDIKYKKMYDKYLEFLIEHQK